MRTSEHENLRFVLGKLAERMVTGRRRAEGCDGSPDQPGVVFVIGAGCSMQYGLPSFVELLSYSYDDLHPRGETRDRAWGLESLRDRLDPHWRTAKPAELRRLLDRYLSRITGEKCTAYLRLAHLARNGYIRAVVNMNFDLLLEQALGAVHGPQRPRFSRTFKLPDDQPTTSGLVIYTPHGSMDSSSSESGERRGVPILDLASSDLFDNKYETDAANELFRHNDVVFLGYSGADAKIAAALTPEKAPRDEEEVGPENYNQIFVLNVTVPDPRLLRIVVARRSTDLIVTGEVAAFENVMEELARAVEEHEDTPESARDRLDPRTVCGDPAPLPVPEAESDERGARRVRNSRHFTKAESQALHRCRQLAVYLRSTMSVAEGGRISIEDHATEIFHLCLTLARMAGVGLTTPEKYVLYCAAYLHDLGYFWAHSGSRRYNKSGWFLLSTHGEDTATLLYEEFGRNPKRRREVFPETYHGQVKPLVETLLLLCHGHSHIPSPDFPSSLTLGESSFDCLESFLVEIDDFRIPVRPPLLYSLFSAAEELTQGHPFFPSPHPLEHGIPNPSGSSESTTSPLEDPVLDLYLRLKSHVVKFRFERETVVACLQEPSKQRPGVGRPEAGKRENLRTFILLASLARSAVRSLNEAAKKEKGWGIELRFHGLGESETASGEHQLVPENGIPEALWAALDEQLEFQLLDLQRLAEESPTDRAGFVSTVLDLLAIYTDPIYLRKDERTPVTAPKARSRGIQRARRMLAQHHDEARQHLIYRYLEIRYWSGRRRSPSLAERLFCKSFEDIYRPAWRFCADKWLYGIDALVMARASLDLGSSRFRDEMILGLRKLLEDKITWCSSDDPKFDHWRSRRSRDFSRQPELWAFGHDGCTLCTSRLAYILATARRLLPADFRKSLRFHGRGLDNAMGGILRYMTGRDPRDPAWWGIEEGQRQAEQEKQEGTALHSADYLAWAAKALAHVFAIDRAIHRSSGGEENWLADRCGIEPDQLVTLFQALWDTLGRITSKDLLGERTEEPHSYILGHVALSYLHVLDLDKEARERLLPPGHEWTRRVDLLRKVVDKFNPRHPAQLSQFFIWPAEVFLARMTADDGRDRALVDKLEQCLKSRVWIKSGEGRGSWGYNIENTQRIVSSLNSFWQLSFLAPERFEPLIAERSWDSVLGS